MSDKPRVDTSAPARGLFHVALKKVASDTVNFEYVPSSEFFHSLLTVESQGIAGFRRGPTNQADT
jgi:hypothetical protein